jgi:UDP-glucose 4-epimerase
VRILVTGATGFIGRSLPARLVAEENNTVTALVRRESGEKALLAAGGNHLARADLVTADLRDFEATVNSLQTARPDLIFHLAAAGVRDPFLPLQEALEHNLHGTVNLLRAAFELRAGGRAPQQLIIARTPGEKSAMNHYAASKAAAWQVCRMYARTQAWPVVGAMIFQAYGPGQPLDNLLPAALEAALDGRDFPMTAGFQQRDWIYIDDVVDGLLALAKARLPAGSSVDLGSGRLLSVAHVVRALYDLVGGPGKPQVGVLPARPGEEQAQVADVTFTKEMIGWEAGASIEDGLRRMVTQRTAIMDVNDM